MIRRKYPQRRPHSADPVYYGARVEYARWLRANPRYEKFREIAVRLGVTTSGVRHMLEHA